MASLLTSQELTRPRSILNRPCLILGGTCFPLEKFCFLSQGKGWEKISILKLHESFPILFYWHGNLSRTMKDGNQVSRCCCWELSLFWALWQNCELFFCLFLKWLLAVFLGVVYRPIICAECVVGVIIEMY